MKISVNSACPCGSKNKYKKCCKVYHNGTLPKKALELMKSRYCAYALRDYKYIINTTHPLNPEFSEDRESWGKSILDFSDSVSFDGLEILEFIDGEEEAFVSFKAILSCSDRDCSFIEKSRFLKEENKWFYVDGVTQE